MSSDLSAHVFLSDCCLHLYPVLSVISPSALLYQLISSIIKASQMIMTIIYCSEIPGGCFTV